MPSDETVRAFIALDPPGNLREQLAAAIESIDRKLKTDLVKWVKAEQIHLTLRFLGDVPAADLEEISAGIARACAQCGPFTLHLGGLGAFPDVMKPSVLWTGVAGDTDALSTLVHQIDYEIAGVVDAADMRAFVPHVTVGRVKEAPAKKLDALGAGLAKQKLHFPDAWNVTHVKLMKSELARAGAKHTVLSEAKLGG
jgi:RNA 2',3'-cyclic 3'-phosphodiesterase